MNEEKIYDRIDFVFNLKNGVDNEVWKGFAEKQYDVPLIYYTDTSSYVANPTDKFLASFPSTLVFENDIIKIYKTKNRVDDIPFHLETGMTLGDSTSEYSYHSPFMQCSSFEGVAKKIPNVLSTEEWATMIMHEYFHGFQYKHKAYMDYSEKEVVQIQPDTLISLYKNDKWYKQSIDKENNFLLNAIATKDSIKVQQAIDSFFIARKERRKMTKEKTQFEITVLENSYETLEGTARYVEYSLYKKFSTQKPDSKLLQSDSSFKSFKKFRNYSIEKDKWLYLTDQTTYFYAIGFNMARLLDKLKVEYKSRLFKEYALSLEDLLRDRK